MAITAENSGGAFLPGGSAAYSPGGTYKVPGYVVTEHFFKVPLDHSGKTPGEISVFAREVCAPNKTQQQLPYLVYMQGGPGFSATLPIDAGGWLRSATNYFKVILLDQRGTGRSAPISCKNLTRQGTPEQQAEYLKFFRADSIVQDCEMVRKALVSESNQGGRWSLLCQSFGGFCAVHYLSVAPQGLVEVMLAGGLPPLVSEQNPADDVYKVTFQKVIAQNEKFYKRYPQDVELVWDIVKFLASQPEGGVRLSSGSLLTPRSLQLLGCSALGFAGGFDRLHFLLETVWDSEEKDEISCRFLKGYESWMAWETNPLYVLLHEPIYTQGPGTNWAAHRVRTNHLKSQFDAVECAQEGRPVFFTGEMVFPWMLDDFKELGRVKEAANLVQSVNDWGTLYDLDILKNNTVPVASITYYEDMFVNFDLAQQTAQHIQGIRQWVTNEYAHSGIRDDGARIFEKLLGMARDTILLS
ncbi:hypothetical protein BSKO_05665 [Bryopsis sp. KO-2023]|nr:hypothetical protein BSKO_05665 [Bryopsis sp. KO-2023]